MDAAFGNRSIGWNGSFFSVVDEIARWGVDAKCIDVLIKEAWIGIGQDVVVERFARLVAVVNMLSFDIDGGGRCLNHDVLHVTDAAVGFVVKAIDLIACTHTFFVERGFRVELADDLGVFGKGFFSPTDSKDDTEDEEGKDNIDKRSCKSNSDTRCWLFAVKSPFDFVRRCSPLFLHPCDFDITAKQAVAKLPFNTVFRPAVEGLSKADAKDLDTHASAFGNEVVAELVNEDEKS